MPELSKLIMEENAPGRSQATNTSSKTLANLKKISWQEEEPTEEEKLRAQLERVKAENANLLRSLASVRSGTGGISGGELQRKDIQDLRNEVESKRIRLSELRQANMERQDLLDILQLTLRDWKHLVPTEENELRTRIDQLEKSLIYCEEEAQAIEVKNKQYSLLERRTRREKEASEQEQCATKELKDACKEDLDSLTQRIHQARSLKETAERALSKAVVTKESIRKDWNRKLHDRRKEVEEIEKKKALVAEAAAAAAKLAACKERAEAERLAALNKSKEARVEARFSSVIPRLEVLEGLWSRIRALSNAREEKDIVQSLKHLQERHHHLEELLALAKGKESLAQQEVNDLRNDLDVLNEMASIGSHDTLEDAEELRNRVLKAEQTCKERENQLDRLRQICALAEQGLNAILNRAEAFVKEDTTRLQALPSKRNHRRSSIVKAGRLSVAGLIEQKKSSKRASRLAMSRPVDSNIGEIFIEGNKDTAYEFFPTIQTLAESVKAHFEKLSLRDAEYEHDDAISKPTEEPSIEKSLGRSTLVGPMLLLHPAPRTPMQAHTARLSREIGFVSRKKLSIDEKIALDPLAVDSSDEEGGPLVTRTMIKNRAQKLLTKPDKP